MPWFDNQQAKISHEPGRTSVLYGGNFYPDGPGHGHVVAQGGPFGENIVYWRLPESEGGAIVIDNMLSSEALRDHLTGF